MTEDDDDPTGEKFDTVEELVERLDEKGLEEGEGQYTISEQKVVDWDSLFEDVSQWLEKPVETQARGKRFLWNLFHMTMSLGTAGVYVFLYFGYQGWRFFSNRDLSDYKETIYVAEPVTEDEEEE